MAGWFYQPPPQPPVLTPEPPGVTPFGNAPPTPVGPGSVRAAILSTWPPESWPAQSGDIVASSLARTWANPPPPQPFYGTRPVDVLLRWPQEDWPTQKLIGGGVGALTASVFVGPQTVAALSRQLLTLLKHAWPQEDWPAQRAGQIASLFATVVNPPVFFASRSRALQSALQSVWTPEEWRAQSECGIAAGLAQLQQPPIYLPSPIAPKRALLRSLWPQEDWGSQRQPNSAGWFPPLVTATAKPIPHTEWQSWPQEMWAAQRAAIVAGRLALAPQPQPYLNTALYSQIRAIWGPEDWKAQNAATIAGLLAQLQVVEVPYTSTPQFPQSLWLPEFWAAQRAATSPWLAPAPPVVQYVLEWTAIYQLVNAGFVVNVTYATDPVVPAEYVISQSPAASTVTGVPQAVTIVVSTGPAAPPGFTSVPDCTGLFAKTATDTLQAAFISVDRYLWVLSSQAEGTVVTQSIDPFRVVAAGTIVQLTLSAGPAKTPPTLTVPLVH